jgi:hypothetical protein
VVFFSDNGPTPDGSAGPFRGRKHTLYEGGVRSPAAMRWTGTLEAGKQSKAMVAAEDLFPTLLKMTALAPPQGVLLDGRDFSGCLTGDAPSPREHRCWLWTDCDSIRTARYKMIRFADHRELYDLQNDVAEGTNIAAGEKDLADDLERKLDAWQASVPIYPSHVPVRGVRSLKPAPADDALEVRAVRDGKGGAGAAQPLGLLLGQCERFPIRSGDRIEYDVLVAGDSSSAGVSISIIPPLTRKKAARGGAIDAEQYGAAGAVSPEERAVKRQWTRRTLGLANFGGKMLDSVWLNIDVAKPASYHLYVDNVVIRRADDSVVEIYREGKPHEQRRGLSPAFSQVSIKVAQASSAQP